MGVRILNNRYIYVYYPIHSLYVGPTLCNTPTLLNQAQPLLLKQHKHAGAASQPNPDYIKPCHDNYTTLLLLSRFPLLHLRQEPANGILAPKS